MAAADTGGTSAAAEPEVRAAAQARTELTRVNRELKQLRVQLTALGDFWPRR
jgi:hypothetical protein